MTRKDIQLGIDTYSRAIEEEWEYHIISKRNMAIGLCYFYKERGVDFESFWDTLRPRKCYIGGTCPFEYGPYSPYLNNHIEGYRYYQPLKNRLDFLINLLSEYENK